MARIGYARVSSAGQSLERQLKALESCSKVFQEKVSGKGLERAKLASMLHFLRSGDIVVVAELDRLGRNNKDLTSIMETIRSKGATLEILSFPSFNGIEDINLRELLNGIMLELFKYQAESERKRIKERQAQGIQLAKEQGKYTGRKPKYCDFNDPNLKHAIELYESGEYTMKTVSNMTRIPLSTFSRYYKKFQETKKS
ncbi:recombinase family protein [Vagococcus fluvialis]|uniref:Recombinase family protein n=1 Tax=Vagococcus fluvialis TaxID=2738 RepID=A0A7X6I344_9ENTE|nr:recombinase family protein [Vagococcus fluvialis]NKC68046.1 recombinase family protein [Vagococcus fluvialis]